MRGAPGKWRFFTAATLELDYQIAEDKYSENMLNLTVLLAYVRKLLGDAKIVRFLNTRHAGMLVEFERIAASEGM